MIGCIKAISPCMKSASPPKAVPGLAHRVGAKSGEERTLNASAQVERAARCCRCFDSDTQTRCDSVTVMVLVSSSLRAARGQLHPRSAKLSSVPRTGAECKQAPR
eukprot:scaffold29834_cov35-Phaeocystis_antarctica.AAC.1